MAQVESAGEVREKVSFEENAGLTMLFGPGGRNLKTLEREVGIAIHSRGNELTLVGYQPAVGLVQTLLTQIYKMVKRGFDLSAEDLIRAVHVLQEDPSVDVRDIFTDTVLVTSSAFRVTPKGLAQKRYVDAIRRHDLVFGIGPAGTGKTYLAMAMAVAALMDRQIKRIVLTRPAVEAGEKLGFLPGDLVEKVNPYLRPLYDALNDLLGLEKGQTMLERGQIEVAPLAFMRGRTLNDSFVILDEAQNTTPEQMKMFLTRLGYDSRAVVNGDVTQVDLPTETQSGLKDAWRLLRNVDGMAFCEFTDADVVRHPLVQRIIKAYEERDARRAPQARPGDGARRDGSDDD